MSAFKNGGTVLAFIAIYSALFFAVTLTGLSQDGDVSPVWTAYYNVGLGDLDIDVDGDGMISRLEADFGTDPYDPMSVFSIDLLFSLANVNLDISWFSVTNIRYQLQTSTGLIDWDDWQDPILGTGHGLNHSVTVESSEFRRFYRAMVVPPLDSDGDLLNDYEESLLGTKIFSPDSDGDGDSDGYEFLTLKTNPLVGVMTPELLVNPPHAISNLNLSLALKAGVGDSVTITGGASTISGHTDQGGEVQLEVELKQNRLNRLAVSGRNSEGQVSATRIIDVIHDGQAPFVHVDFPGNNAQVFTSHATIAGRVGDSLSGHEGLEVTVDGSAAEVIEGLGTNGTFERRNVPLNLGENLISVVVTDVHGNNLTKSIIIHRADQTIARISSRSGGDQTGQIHTRLPVPVEVEVFDSNGNPWVNKMVTFKAIRSDGRLSATSDAADLGQHSFQAITDNSGHARAWWTLGGGAGCGNNRLQVTTEEVSGIAYFCASASPAPATQINIGSGNGQIAEIDKYPLEQLRAWVSDTCNGVENIPVTFRVVSGQGKVDDLDEITVVTSSTGHASVDFQLGPIVGNQVVEASFPGSTSSAAIFTLRGVAREVGSDTTFVGLVQDNTDQPIGGARVRLEIDGEFSPPVSTDEEGRFRIENVSASGLGHLHIDGLVATTIGGDPVPPGSYPKLHFEHIVVPNVANELPGPVLLPWLNPANAVSYDGTHDIALTCEGIEGLQMIVKAGSMTRSDGSRPSTADPAILSLNQVHHEDVPMPMPDGASPPFAWTLQPGGATFDPPITIRYPNMSGLPAGTVAYFLSYNHAVESFEIVSSGHVTDDGAYIMTDEGGGLTIAGWGCNCPPYSATGECATCIVELDIEPADGDFQLMDEATLVAECNVEEVLEYHFEIQRRGDSSWHTIYRGGDFFVLHTLRVAGQFDLRVTATLSDDTCVSKVRPMRVKFPDASTILADSNILAEMRAKAAETTVDENASNGQMIQEHSFYIELDTETGIYSAVLHESGPTVSYTGSPKFVPSSPPRDSHANPIPNGDAKYTVGVFHTHPNAVHPRSAGWSRPVGASASDKALSVYYDLPGFISDYVADPNCVVLDKYGNVMLDSAGNPIPGICGGHPITDPRVEYIVGPPNRRTTP